MKPDIIKTYIELDGGSIVYIPASASFTTSIAWETSERKSCDSSGTSQSITFLKKSGRRGRSFQIQFSLSQSEEEQPIYDVLSAYENVVGKTGNIYYSGIQYGRIIVTDGSFTLSNDGIRGIDRLSISFNCLETKVFTQRNNAPNVRFV